MRFKYALTHSSRAGAVLSMTSIPYAFDGSRVPCPHPDLCGGVAFHIFGTDESIRCIERTPFPESDKYPRGSILKKYSIADPIPVGGGDVMETAPATLLTQVSYVAELLATQSDHFRYLHLQAGWLNANRPQVHQLPGWDLVLNFVQGETETSIEWVAPTSIVHVGAGAGWGVPRGNELHPVDLTRSLAFTMTEEERFEWTRALMSDPVEVTAVSGPVGPIYYSADVMAPRKVFLARALRLPAITANVRKMRKIDGDPTFVETSQINEDPRIDQIRRLRLAMTHANAARRWASDDEYLVYTATSSPWLMFPESARRTEEAYRLAYPLYVAPFPDWALVSDDAFAEWVASSAG